MLSRIGRETPSRVARGPYLSVLGRPPLPASSTRNVPSSGRWKCHEKRAKALRLLPSLALGGAVAA